MKGSLKPNTDLNKKMQFLKRIEEEVAMVVPDWRNHAFLQINETPGGISYSIDENCPIEKYQKIEQVIIEQAALQNISVNADDID